MEAPAVELRRPSGRRRRGVRMRVMAAVGAVVVVAALAWAGAASAEGTGGTAAVAWGQDYPSEQLGTGYEINYEVNPGTVRDLTNIASVVAAGKSSFALLSNGTVRSWGGDFAGILGNGKRPEEASGSPVAVDERISRTEVRELTGAKAIAASYGVETHAMALVNDSEHEGEVATWGASEYGERGNGEYDFESEEHAIEPREAAVFVRGPEEGRLKHIVAIAAGGDSALALQEDAGATTLWTWGGDQYTKLGIGEAEERSLPTCKGNAAAALCSPEPRKVDLPAGVKVTAISSGRTAAYAVLSNGRVMAWGENKHGELGNGTVTNSAVPTYVCAVGHEGACPSGPYLEGVTAVSGGHLFALALRTSGEVVGWGANGDGELGQSSSEECKKSIKACQKTPKVVEGLEGITAISTGGNSSLALNGSGELYAFGENEHGELGPVKESEKSETCGSTMTRCERTPGLIEGLSNVGGMSAGEFEPGEAHSLAYLTSGSGPGDALSLTPEANALAVTWTLSAPKAEYYIRWKEVPPSSNGNMEKAREWSLKREEDLGKEASAREELEAAEEAKASEEVIKKLKEEEEKFGSEAREAKEKAEAYEKAAEKEYPFSKKVLISKTCGAGKEWCYTITEVLSSTSYYVELNRIGAETDEIAHITGKPLP